MHNRRMDADWFKVRKRELRVTNEDIAAAIGRDVSIVSKALTAKIPFSLEYVAGFAKALDVSRAEVLARAGIIEGEGAPQTNAIPVQFEGASLERMRDDLPIYGSALGAAREIDGEAIELTTLNRAEVVQYAKRPVLLNGNARAYGLFVSGSSMEPRHMDGEMVVVDPKGRYRSGEDVVVYLGHPEVDDGETARAVLVKKFIRRTSDYVELEQYSPAKVFRILAREAIEIHRVVPWSELLS